MKLPISRFALFEFQRDLIRSANRMGFYISVNQHKQLGIITNLPNLYSTLKLYILQETLKSDCKTSLLKCLLASKKEQSAVCRDSNRTSKAIKLLKMKMQ
jgi:hypothetical protein